ncbi:MAG: hypothetical protein JST40_08480 [Armatimonadetes bacterium]|nr:hypothetical protein [Armatimonadota bacterium]
MRGRSVRLATLATGFTALLVSALVLPPTQSAEAQTRRGPSEVELGDVLFHDTSLSEPAGQGCVSCHSQDTGYSLPDSNLNLAHGMAPGAVPNRFGFRKPPTVAYTPFLPKGDPYYDEGAQAFVGGLFYDGRAKDNIEQAKGPFLNPNEMNNLTEHGLGDPAKVIDKIKNGPSGIVFREVYGMDIFEHPTDEVYDLVARAITAYIASDEVSPYSSKYDLYLEGKANLSLMELLGLRLATGTFTGRKDGPPYPRKAFCSDCHMISDDLSVAKDSWTNSCYANLGVPKNPNNPWYTNTDPVANPYGYNSLGFAFKDYGLAGYLYPKQGIELGSQDPLAINGTIKAPTLRNVDKRPYPGFVKAYMHNGVFKSLEEVVNFYVTRNRTTVEGEIIDFTKPNPYQGLQGTPLWPEPEFPDPNTMINPAGLPSDMEGEGVSAEMGNMIIHPYDEVALVAFMKTLSDGYHDVAGFIVPMDYTFLLEAIPLEFEVRTPGSTTALETQVVFMDSDGYYSFTPTVQPGTYDIAVKGPHWLRKVIPNVEIKSYGAVDANAVLVNGDIDGDNAVTVFDYLILSDYFDKSMMDEDWDTVGANGFAPSDTDLDGDGTVTVFDYVILVNSFDQFGDE